MATGSRSKAGSSRGAKGQSTKAVHGRAASKSGGGSKRSASRAKGAKSSAGNGKAASTSAVSKRTTNHNVIRRWIEARGGKPTIVNATKGGGKSAGLLRIDFPGYSGRGDLQEISWDQFFKTFDANNLVFLYQDKTATGRPSRFSKFVSKTSAKK